MSAAPVIIPLCRHIRTHGLRCRSAALSGQDFCYFHVRLHRDHPVPDTPDQTLTSWKDEHIEAFRQMNVDPLTVANAYPRQNHYSFPPLEDAESVQVAGSMLFHAIAHAQIHPGRARLLLDALKVVNSSLRARATTPADPAASPVREVSETEDGRFLAPADPAGAPGLTPGEFIFCG